MRSDTGIPVRHCGVAARAIPRAMVGIDHMYFDSLECITLVENDGKWSNCEGRLVMQIACYFL